jgi:transposase
MYYFAALMRTRTALPPASAWTPAMEMSSSAKRVRSAPQRAGAFAAVPLFLKVEQVRLESTGVYWKAVWRALEGYFPLILANPFQVKNRPGCKTDARDSAWWADLVAYGLMRASLCRRKRHAICVI